MQGGHFEHGMFTGLVSSAGAQGIGWYGRNWSLEGQIAASAVLGGTVSVVGGGKFASGAMTAAFQMMYNEQMHRGPYMRELAAIDKIYRQSLADYPTPGEFYESLGGEIAALAKNGDWTNSCAARMSFALNESGTLSIPCIPGQTRMGGDGRNYFTLAKDMDAWLSSRRIWGAPFRIYTNSSKSSPINGVVSQSGFAGGVTGHLEYVYHGIDGHNDSIRTQNAYGAFRYYQLDGITTKQWKGGKW